MLGAYRQVLRVPGAVAFASAGLIARFPLSMQTLGTVLLVADATGSYALAGAVSATLAAAQALLGPVLGRLVDRHGQARVLLPALAVHTAGAAVLIACAAADLPVWTLFPAAALWGGSFAQAGSLVRARWAHALGGSPLLPTAFSLESVLDEVVFVVGPVLVTTLATQVSPIVGVVAAWAFAATGSLALAALRRTEPPAHPVTGRGPSALRLAGLRVMVVVGLATGGIFGSVEVATVAFTDERGSPGAAGIVLALLAAGSLLSGLGYGTVSWRTPAARRFVLGVGVLALVTVPLLAAGSVPVLAGLVFLAGFAISPALIAGFGLLEELVPAASRTEGLTWFGTGLGLGVAVAASIAGQVVDASGARAAFGVTVAAGVLAALTALAGARTFSRAGR
ncbi:MAG TPA: MFS transporter [Mycobacteriales bacterium]